MKKPEFIHPDYRWFRGGSREICDPPPTDTDEDYFVLCMSGGLTLRRHLHRHGFHLSDSGDYDNVPEFEAYRYKHYNVIVVRTLTHFESIQEATKLCKELNLQGKSQRIIVHAFMKELFEGK